MQHKQATKQLVSMASRALLFAAVLLAGLAAAPAAEAQLVGNLLGVIHINGTLHCSVGTTKNIAATPVFANALVQLKCGDNVVSSATTDTNGVFTMSLNLLISLVSTLLGNCQLVVDTPLATCDASLPSGILQSALQLLSSGGLLGGLLGGFVNLIPTGFSLIPSLG